MTVSEWKIWEEQWTDYSIVQRLEKECEEYQAAMFQSCLRTVGREIFQGLPFQQASERDDVKKVVSLFEDYFFGEMNVTFEWYRFFRETEASISQQKRMSESLDALPQIVTLDT